MNHYVLERCLSNRLVALTHPKHGHALWTSAPTRKPTKCCECEQPITPPEHAWRPLTNGLNRMHRICTYCLAPG